MEANTHVPVSRQGSQMALSPEDLKLEKLIDEEDVDLEDYPSSGLQDTVIANSSPVVPT